MENIYTPELIVFEFSSIYTLIRFKYIDQQLNIKVLIVNMDSRLSDKSGQFMQ